jgi:hypothetical protein
VKATVWAETAVSAAKTKIKAKRNLFIKASPNQFSARFNAEGVG